jgi:hypothetical protein
MHSWRKVKKNLQDEKPKEHKFWEAKRKDFENHKKWRGQKKKYWNSGKEKMPRDRKIRDTREEENNGKVKKETLRN